MAGRTFPGYQVLKPLAIHSVLNSFEILDKSLYRNQICFSYPLILMTFKKQKYDCLSKGMISLIDQHNYTKSAGNNSSIRHFIHIAFRNDSIFFVLVNHRYAYRLFTTRQYICTSLAYQLIFAVIKTSKGKAISITFMHTMGKKG